MKKEDEESTLVHAAKAIGSVAGKVASLVGATPAEATPGGAPAGRPAKKARAGKLPPKNKQRLPRKQKKAMKKAATAQKKA